MAKITIEQLAKAVGLPAKVLVARLDDAGIKVKGVNEVITDEQRQLLLDHLKSSHLSTEKPTSTLKLKKSAPASTIVQRNVINVTVLKRRAHYDVDKELAKETAKTIKPISSEEGVEKLPPAEKESSNFSEELEIANIDTTEVSRPEGENHLTVQDPALVAGAQTIKQEVRNQVSRQKLKKVKPDVKVKTKKDSEVKSKNIAEVVFDNGLELPKVSEKEKNISYKEVTIPEAISVAELAHKMSIKATELIKNMMKLGAMATINQVIDQDIAALVAEELGYTVKILKESSLEDEIARLEENGSSELLPRPPVVTIMGHVDHGKTSLLDFIRRTKVAQREAGGITQHIGAYHVETDRGMITFLDTPGHEAFTAMRARGAKVTDIVVLIVAADDGVMPQTVEAIEHSKAAEVPLIVAINKIDKPQADEEKIKSELSKHGVIPEEWGSDTMFRKISAKTGEGIDELLEAILLLAEVKELKAPVACRAKGTVIEARLDRGHGAVASLLVQEGTLKQGDIILAGLYYGKVRALFDDSGKKTLKVGPSIPIEVLGLSGTPSAGDEFMVFSSEKKAREVALFRQGKYREVKLAKQQSARLENLMVKMQDQATKTLNIVLKADVRGSAEAIIEILSKAEIANEVKINVISSGVGGITESDINLALASDAIVIGFNVRADNLAKNLAGREGLAIRYYSIIYKLVEDIKAALAGLLDPTYEEQVLGIIEVREVFKSSKFGTIAGCMVVEGVAKRGGKIRLLRDNVVIYDGEIESLRRFKDDAQEVRQGMECGVGIKGYGDIKAGDKIEVYKTTLVKRVIPG